MFINLSVLLVSEYFSVFHLYFYYFIICCSNVLCTEYATPQETSAHIFSHI